MRLAGSPSRADASRTGATFINLAMASKRRSSIARALMTRPAQSLFFERGAECANSETWVAGCMNFPPVVFNQNQRGVGFPDRLDQLNLALYTRRTSSYEIDTSNDFFSSCSSQRAPRPRRHAPQCSADSACRSRKVTAALTHRYCLLICISNLGII